MRIVTTLPMDDLRKAGPAAREIEAAGYDDATALETAHQPFLSLAAVETERVELLTAVAIAFPRSPMVCANAAWDLQIASKGRFVLWLGPQIRAHNERRFSVPWSAAAARAPLPASRPGPPRRSQGRAYNPRLRASGIYFS